MSKAQGIKMRRRYISVQIERDGLITEMDLLNVVLDSFLQLFGEYGLSFSQIILIDYDPLKSQAVFRCSHRALSMAKASIAAVTRIGKRPATLHIRLISGTLKALGKKLDQ